MIKFGKNFRLSIQMDESDPTGAIIIEPPFTIQFNIKRNTFATANTGTFQIYNLGEDTRNRIFQDIFDTTSKRKVIFQAGYGENIPIVFVGSLRRAYSHRQGTEIITEVYCFDDGQGDALNSFSNHTVSAGTGLGDIVKMLMGDMTNTDKGDVGDMGADKLKRGTSLIGNSFSLIDKYTGGNVFIDNNTLLSLKPHEVIEGYVTKIDSSSGLIGTPKRQDAKLSADMIFEPQLLVGQFIEIESQVQKQFNGQFKVIGIEHDGIISETIAGEVKTSVELLIPQVITNQPLMLVKDGMITPVGYGKIDDNIRGIYGHLIKYNAPPKLQITKNISWLEVLQNYSSQGSTPSVQVIANLVSTATAVQNFIDTHFPGKHLSIGSGWRSKKYNATVKGASPTSHHINGLALDFNIIGVPLAEQHAAIRSGMVGEIITYSWGQHYGLQYNKEVKSGDK